MKRLLVVLLIAIMTFPTMAFAQEDSTESRIEKLEKKIDQLEKRISRLEKSVFNDEITAMADAANSFLYGDNASSEENDQSDSESFTLASGVYVVGEDIEAGSYKGVIQEGIGYVDLFKSYEDYLEKDGAHYSALLSILMATQSAIDGLSDYPTQASQYVTETGSLKLVDGMCMAIDNVTLTVSKTS